MVRLRVKVNIGVNIEVLRGDMQRKFHLWIPEKHCSGMRRL